MNALAGFTADQWGLVTTAQATGAGVDSPTLARLVGAGLLEHVRRGVYAVTAAPEDSLRAVRAAWLHLDAGVPAWQRPLLDPRGVLSHATAAHVHDLGDLLIGTFEFTAPGRRSSTHPDIAFHRLPLPEGDVVRVDGLPVTTVDRTIADLLAIHIDGGHVGDMIYQALRRRQVDIAPLTRRVGRYARRYGVPGGDGTALVNALLEQSSKTMPDAEAETGDRGYRDEVGRMARLVSEAVRAGTEASPEIRRMQDDLDRVVSSSPGILRVQEEVALMLAEHAATRKVVARAAESISRLLVGDHDRPRSGQEADDPELLRELRQDLRYLADPDSSARSATVPDSPLVDSPGPASGD